MNSILKKTLIGLSITTIVISGLHFTSPHDFKIEKEILINQPKNFTFNYLKFFRNGNTWNPFLEKDPKAIIKLNGFDGTVGASCYWSGNSSVGTGEQEIKAIEDGIKIDYEVRFTIPFKASHHSYFITQTENEKQTKVIWGMTGKMKFPMNIFFKYGNMNQSLQTDFEHGLNKLKTQLDQLIAVPEIKL